MNRMTQVMQSSKLKIKIQRYINSLDIKNVTEYKIYFSSYYFSITYHQLHSLTTAVHQKNQKS